MAGEFLQTRRYEMSSVTRFIEDYKEELRMDVLFMMRR